MCVGAASCRSQLIPDVILKYSYFIILFTFLLLGFIHISLNTSRVPAVLLRGISRNFNIVLSIFLAPNSYHRSITGYHRNVFPIPKTLVFIVLYTVNAARDNIFSRTRK
jgi:hypothetical protein